MQQPQAIPVIRRLGVPLLFVAAALSLVYALALVIPQVKAEKAVNAKAAGNNSATEILRDISALPETVARMRTAILGAAMSGEIEALRIPVEMNEIPPMAASEKIADLVAYWKKISGDGEGREILAILVELFRTGFVRKSPGTNEEMYIWPYFAEYPVDKLTSAQQVELLTLVAPEKLKAMQGSGKYDHYRIGIGRDGTWHFFWNGVH
jgi:hypothetical protein